MLINDMMYYISIICGIILPHFFIKAILEKDKDNDKNILGACVCSGIIVFTVLSYLRWLC